VPICRGRANSVAQGRRSAPSLLPKLAGFLDESPRRQTASTVRPTTDDLQSTPALFPLPGRAVITTPANFSPTAPAKCAVTMSPAPAAPAMTALDLDHIQLGTELRRNSWERRRCTSRKDRRCKQDREDHLFHWHPFKLKRPKTRPNQRLLLLPVVCCRPGAYSEAPGAVDFLAFCILCPGAYSEAPGPVDLVEFCILWPGVLSETP
jgi:hypothetical protein